MFFAKLTGSICLITACTLYSRLIFLQYKRYIADLNQIYQILYRIRGEIAYSRSPLDDILYHIRNQFPEPFHTWLSNLMKQITLRKFAKFDSLWTERISEDLNTIRLKPGHRMLLAEFGQHLGSIDYETEAGTMQMVLERFKTEIQKEESTLKTKNKLCNYLGFMTGLFLVILLL